MSQSTPDRHGTTPGAGPATTRTRSTAAPERGTGRWSRLPAWAALLTLLVVTGAGLAYSLAKPATYRAHTMVVVVPSDTGDEVASASLFDTLSRGQIVATASTIYSQSRWHTDQPDVTVSAGEVTPSSVIDIQATGPDKDATVTTLENLLERAQPQVQEVIKPYTVKRLSETISEPVTVGMGTTTLAVISIIAGLALASLAYALVARVAPLLRTRGAGTASDDTNRGSGDGPLEP